MENLLITSAAAWYIAYAVTSTHGPFGMFERLRNFHEGRWHGRSKAIQGVMYDSMTETTRVIAEHPSRDGLLDCIICLIFWLALVIGYLQGLTVLESIAAAGVGLWLHGFTGWLYKQ